MKLEQLKEALEFTPRERERIDKAACKFRISDPRTCKMKVGKHCRSGCQYHDRDLAEREANRIVAEKAYKIEEAGE